MPSFSSKVQLSNAATGSNIVLADVDRIKGAFKVYTSTVLNATSVNYFSDGQIVYVSDSGSLFKATVTPADPGNGIFNDTVTFSKFSFVTGSFVSASFNDSSNVLTLFGEPSVGSGSSQISMSVDLSSLAGGGGGGSGDITAVINGSGLLGGALTGNATLSVDSGSLAGSGLAAPVGGKFNLDTGSTHFTEGVQKTNLDGSEF